MKERNSGAIFGPSAAQGPYPNDGRPWSNSEKRTLSRFRGEGADAISGLLGRSPKAVRRMASKLHVSLRVRPGEVCPVCGERRVREHTSAAKRGMCPACWAGELAKLRDDAADQRRAERSYQAAKKRAQRAGGGR